MMIWYIKLAIILSAFAVISVLAASNWTEKKHYFAFLLICLFSQTGFAYQFKQGYFTSFAEIIFFVLLFVFALSKKGRPQDAALTRRVKFFLFVSLIGVFSAFFFTVPLINIFIEFKSYVMYVFYVFLVPYLVTNRKDLRKCLWCFVLFGFIPICYTLPNLGSLADITGVQRSTELSANWGALNILVGFLLPVICFSLALYTTSIKSSHKAILIVFIMSAVVILFFTKTRSGWISLAISIMFFAVLTRQKMKYVFFGFLIILLLVISGKMDKIRSIVEYRLMNQTIEQQDTSLEQRLMRWQISWRTFKAYPLTGSGWGGYLPIDHLGRVANTSLYLLPRWHNVFFELLSQLGIFGVLAFYGILARLWISGYKMSKNHKQTPDQVILVGLLTAALAIFIYAHAEQQFFKIETASVSWFVLGLLVNQTLLMSEKQDEM